MPENVEIERRFLVDGRFERPWVHESTTCIEIKQWYLDHKKFNVSIEHNAVIYKNIIPNLRINELQKARA